MEPTTTSKQRKPRCREWERQRRNKFNEAITRLGELVKSINKTNSDSTNGDDNVQYPKIEIVQKAIICLSNCAQERTQLKAEILALEVKLEAVKNSNPNKKDISVQVSFITNKKYQSGKYIKILKQNANNKQNNSKDKTNLECKPQKENKEKEPTKQKIVKNRVLPKLLPLANNLKKGPEGTFVMLPAAPYLFPQRPLLIPTAPPTIVLVDTNLQNLNKPPAVPVFNKSNSDITKTTMVNVLPISAYSRPLSASKTKRSSKPKSTNVKRNTKKPENKTVKQSDSNKESSDKVELKKSKENTSTTEENDKPQDSGKSIETLIATHTEKQDISTKRDLDNTNKKNKSLNVADTITEQNNDDCKKINNDKSVTMSCTPSTTDTVTLEKNITSSSPPAVVEKNTSIDLNTDSNVSKCNKVTTEKQSPEVKSKENKLPNILDSNICENVVDGGNARLELAEEFLAASPTAAFLMSFPLVSGNRADSPVEEPHNSSNSNPKDQRQNEITSSAETYFAKTNATEVKIKSINKHSTHKQNEQDKYLENNIAAKPVEPKIPTSSVVNNVSSENPFLNLPTPSLISTSCTLTDPTFGIDFDCNINKAMVSQTSNYASSNNFFYKSDPFSSVKSTIYSTSSISSGHDFNSLGLYPCAMEKYTTKSKTEYSNVEDNIMKIGSSRLTYDIDLGWSQKSFDFVNCTTSSNSFNKDNILTNSTAYSTSYNPFNPEFHVPLTTVSSKKDNISNKPVTSFSEPITSFYSQSSNLWPEDTTNYANTNPKAFITKHQNYAPIHQPQSNNAIKPNVPKHVYESKHDNPTDSNIKSSNIEQHIPDKFIKKSPSKMHINWMTSEIRPMQSNCNQTQTEMKESNKSTYNQTSHTSKKQDQIDGNYFPINMHNFSSQGTHEEFSVWPTARPVGTTEISIEPPPINLPTLEGDLALGPHDKKKMDVNRGISQSDLQNGSNFLSVTQLMNRSSDIMSSRYHLSNIETSKIKQTLPTESNRKIITSRFDTHPPCYVFNDPKTLNHYDNMNQFSHVKSKSNKVDKNAKATQKNSYSAEALIRGGTCSQKVPENSTKFMMPPQKYNDFNITQDSSVAQVSHFPPILDYSESGYNSGQQFSGTTLYNSTTNTISNSFYSNFMPGTGNLMPSNYTNGPFSSEFIDYNQTAECNYTNHKYEELKMRNNISILQQDKVPPSNYKSSRRDSAAKHKLECSKKDSNKKYQSKRPKVNNETEEWTDTSHLLWQNKMPSKRSSNIMSEELPFPNYVSNQMPTQYQPDFFNSHLMSSNIQNVSHNVDRSLASFPVTSRANFNLSTIFPEITMKVQ